jgi:hypothetical protein
MRGKNSLMRVCRRRADVLMWHCQILVSPAFLWNEEESKNKWAGSEALDENSDERLSTAGPSLQTVAGVSTSLFYSPSYVRAAHSHYQCIFNMKFFKYHCKASSKHTSSKLSLTYVARDTDKYRDLEIHTEHQRNMLSARNILWICKYLSVWYGSFAL